MRVLPMVVFAAATGIGSGVMFFKHTSQLNYENAVLTLRVYKLERAIESMREAQQAHETEIRLPAVADDNSRSRRVSQRSRR